MPPFPQRYNDGFRGWPVRPHDRQHPVRGSLDPRPIPSWADLPHRCRHCCSRRPPRAGRPRRPHAPRLRDRGRRRRTRTERACAATSASATSDGHRRRPRRARRARPPGQLIKDSPGLVASPSDGVVLHGGRGPSPAQPLRPAGKLKLFADIAPPVIHEVRFYTPPNRAGPGERGTPPACRPRVVGSTGRALRHRRRPRPRQRSSVVRRLVPGRSRARRAPPPVPARALAPRTGESRRRAATNGVPRPDGTLVPRGPALCARTTQTRRRRSASTVAAASATASTGSGLPAPVLDTTQLRNGRYLLVVRAWTQRKPHASRAGDQDRQPAGVTERPPGRRPLKPGPIPALSHAEVVPRRSRNPHRRRKAAPSAAA